MTDEPRPNQAGKKYECPECGATVMCTKGGAGQVQCHGVSMSLVTTKPLPSSD